MQEKVFIYEKNVQKLQRYVHELEDDGFLPFVSNNLYQFLQYAGEMNPDIVIMNIDKDFHSDTNVWKKVEEKLCYKDKCPQVFLNTSQEFKNKQYFHHFMFNDDEIGFREILEIIKKDRTLH